MARTVECVINGTAWQMPASYAAAKKIGEKVGDPLKLALAAHRSGGLVPMSIDDVVNIIAIGCQQAGCSLPAEAIGEFIVDEGVTKYLEIVGRYILLMVSGAGDTPGKQ
jgi:hypothetical protein